MAKEVKDTIYSAPEELDKKLQSLLDHTKSESEALKKILEALDGQSAQMESTSVLKGNKTKKK